MFNETMDDIDALFALPWSEQSKAKGEVFYSSDFSSLNRWSETGEDPEVKGEDKVEDCVPALSVVDAVVSVVTPPQTTSAQEKSQKSNIRAEFPQCISA